MQHPFMKGGIGISQQRQDDLQNIIERIRSENGSGTGSASGDRSGDRELRERFIEDNIPQIKRIVRKMTHSFFVDDSDEYSVALGAFNNAIDRYRPDSGVLFEYYARLLMKNRLLDWMRQDAKTGKKLSLDKINSDDGTPLSEQIADSSSENTQLDIEFEEAMVVLKLKLEKFDLNLPGLVAQFPKHRDSRLLCISVARLLSDDGTLYGTMLKTNRLPVSELAKRSGIPLKTIEKNRASIIFIALIMRSELQAIKSYIEYFEKEATK